MSEDCQNKFQQVARLQYQEIERLKGELDQLKAENTRLIEWIMGSEPSAHDQLRRIYSDGTKRDSERLKAASAAIGYELAKPASTVISINIAEELRLRRLAHLEHVRQFGPPPRLPIPTNTYNPADDADGQDPAA